MGDLDLPLAGEKKDMGAHLLPVLGGGGDYHRGGIFEGTGVWVWVEEASGGDRQAFGVKDG